MSGDSEWTFCPYDGLMLDASGECSKCSFRKPVTADSSSALSWKKVLYEQQSFPDNYTDRMFLRALRTNLNVRQYNYWSVVKSTVVVFQQVSAVVFFCIVFYFTWLREFTAIFQLLLICIVVGFAAASLRRMYTRKQGFDIARRVAFFLCLLFLLTPILRTLTREISDDTIWALSLLLLIVHLYTFDYVSSYGLTAYAAGTEWASRTAENRIQGQGVVALNAAMLSSVLLASRLHSNTQVFLFLALATQLFAVVPIVRGQVQHSATKFTAMNVLWFVLTATMMGMISSLMAVVYVTVLLSVTFLVPLLLTRSVKYKLNIHGPWDEAKPLLVQRE